MSLLVQRVVSFNNYHDLPHIKTLKTKGLLELVELHILSDPYIIIYHFNDNIIINNFEYITPNKH